jgi:hypothetical protein
MPPQPYAMQQEYTQYHIQNQYPPQPYFYQSPQQKISQPQQLQLPSNQPPKPTQLPAQPVANPNNKVAQPAYNAKLQNFPTYMITSLGVNDIHVRSRKVLHQSTPIIVEEPIEEENPNQINNNSSTNPLNQTSSSYINQNQQYSSPTFP